MYLITLTDDPDRTQRVLLETYLVTLRTRWNWVAEQWYIDLICDEVGLELLGYGLVTGNDMLLGRGVSELGALELIDMEASAYPEDPTREGLGSRWKLRYTTKAERDAAR